MKRIPCATYRLQFNRDFRLQDAAHILDYLAELGISDIYASPLFEAGPQSTHGYDTCCFGKLNPGLGTEHDFEQFATALKQRGLGLLLDFVPNHMSATLSNPWWRDVLENGPESAYATFFDINWHPARPDLQNKVLLPVLEDHYGKVLESGKLQLAHQDGRFSVGYYERDFPVNSHTLPSDAFQRVPAILEEFNGKTGDARSFDKLDELIQRQHYRLAYWKVAAEEINYRRFFDVTEMVALKMELTEVFHATHQLVFEWLNSGKITGLRIDHPDGLWDPKEYLECLKKHHPDLYIVVEKILTGDEPLPRDWPVDGTTGYDFLNRANGLFIDTSNASAFDEIYHEFTGNKLRFDDTAYSSRKAVLEKSFASELNTLASRLWDLASRTRNGRDFTFSQLRRALAEVIAAYPVYRTYIAESTRQISEQDKTVIQTAIGKARARTAGRIEPVVFDFIQQLPGLEGARNVAMKLQQLTGPAMAKGLEDTAFYRFNRLVSLNEVGGEPDRFGITPEEFHAANARTARHWPHTLLASATHDTKRGEDVRARLNVLSEMPKEWRDAIARWSRLNEDKKTIVESAPAPDANDEYLFYQSLVGAWPPDADTPEGLKSFRARIAGFMQKAVKEAKTNTSWTDPNPDYENALQNFIERALAEQGNETFRQDVGRFARRVGFFGRVNSLAQTVLKITSPGVPDFYQGAELWDLILVDPDNRRPVDFALRRKVLNDLKGMNGLPTELLGNDEPGAAKLFLIWRALNFRKQHRELFEFGDYIPLTEMGYRSQHVCAFARVWKGQSVVAVAPRLVFGLLRGAEVLPLGREVWRDTAIHWPQGGQGPLRNVLTGESVASSKQGETDAFEVSEALKTFPVALLETA